MPPIVLEYGDLPFIACYEYPRNDIPVTHAVHKSDGRYISVFLAAGLNYTSINHIDLVF